MKEIAIFGGTFDPPTRAHEAVIAGLLDMSDLDEVWVMPSAERKDKCPHVKDQGRIALLNAVRTGSFDDDPRLIISGFEMDLGMPTQTWRTLQALEEGYPCNRFWFVYGADSYHAMPTWQKGEQLQQSLNLILAPRAGFELPEESERLRHLDLPTSVEWISSTMVRREINEGIFDRGHVSNGVAELIAQGLY